MKKTLIILLMIFSLLFPMCINAEEILNEDALIEEKTLETEESEEVVLPSETEENKESELPGIIVESIDQRSTLSPTITVYVGKIDVSAGGYWLNNGKRGSSRNYNFYYNLLKNTLTLKNAKITDHLNGNIIYSTKDLDVKLIGSNYLTNSEENGICFTIEENIYIYGNKTGRLTTTCEKGIYSKNSITIKAVNKFTHNSGTESSGFGFNASNHSDGRIYISDSNINISNSNDGIVSTGNLIIKNSKVIINNAVVGLEGSYATQIINSDITLNNIKNYGLNGDTRFSNMDIKTSKVFINGVKKDNSMGMNGYAIYLKGTNKIQISDMKTGINSKALEFNIKYPGYITVIGANTNYAYGSSFISETYSYINDNNSMIAIDINNGLPSAGYSRTVKLNWKNDLFADKYIIEMYKSKKWNVVGSSTTNSYEVSKGLGDNTKYKFRIKKCYVSGKNVNCESYISAIYATTGPATPSIKVVDSNGKNKVYWSKVSGATSYELYRKEGSSSPVLVYSGSKNYFYDDNVVPRSAYTYTLSAYKYKYDGLYTNTHSKESTPRTITTGLSKPFGVELTTDVGKVNVSFDVNSNLSNNHSIGAEVYRSTSSKGKYTIINAKTVLYADDNNYEDTTVVSKKTYYYKLRTFYVDSNNNKVYSGYTTPKSIKAK